MIPTGGLGAALAFEDAECLALAIAHMKPPDDTALRLKTIRVWEEHRKERLNLVQEFTDRNRKLRQPGGTWIMQYLKEWFVWGLFKVIGPAAASEIYGYDARKFEGLLK